VGRGGDWPDLSPALGDADDGRRAQRRVHRCGE
jgi:hypothetical protein